MLGSAMISALYIQIADKYAQRIEPQPILIYIYIWFSVHCTGVYTPCRLWWPSHIVSKVEPFLWPHLIIVRSNRMRSIQMQSRYLSHILSSSMERGVWRLDAHTLSNDKPKLKAIRPRKRQPTNDEKKKKETKKDTQNEMKRKNEKEKRIEYVLSTVSRTVKCIHNVRNTIALEEWYCRCRWFVCRCLASSCCSWWPQWARVRV